MTKPKLEASISKREGIIAAFKRFSMYVENLSTPTNNIEFKQLKMRFDNAESLLNEYNNIQDQINLLREDNSEDNSERTEFENHYYSNTALASTIIEDYLKSIEDKDVKVKELDTHINNIDSQVNVKLPTINLPTFAGDYNKWMEFYDTFNSLIHNNKNLTNVQKFHYLRSALTSKAAAVIQCQEVSDANYTSAWQSICKRFNNKRLRVYSHVKALYNIQNVSDSKIGVRVLFDEALSHINALEALGQPVKHWDTLLVFIIWSKLDIRSRNAWEFYETADELPTFEEFSMFLNKRCNTLESIDGPNKLNRSNNYYKQNQRPKSDSCFISNNIHCYFCNGNHMVYTCPDLLKLPIDSRLSQVRAKKLCTNCLKKGHTSRDCKISSCKKCHLKHNTILHEDTSSTTSSNRNDDVKLDSQSSGTYVSNNVSQVLLSTACVNISNKEGRHINCRILLDSGSQSNFITEKACSLLNLKRYALQSTVTGISQTILPIKFKTNVKISSLCNKFKADITCLILNKITDNLPGITFDPSILHVPQNVQLADPEFFKSSPIDMLIGSQLFWQLLSVGQISLGNNKPILQKTQLGWIISGPIPGRLTSTNSFVSIDNINEQLKKFWRIEEFEKPQLSANDRFCEELFTNTTERSADGRFIVKIPFLKSISELGESKKAAMTRQFTLENKFLKRPEFTREYLDFMKEYISLGHMSLVTDDNIQPHFYLPHHGVTKEHSSTTKLRVVFDGSAKTLSGLSLNDIQAVGPALQQDLTAILLRFRTHTYVISADIAKMYRQILVHPSQRNLQRIVWRENSHEQLQTYMLNTITYGTASAPFLAIRCLRQLAFDNESLFPEACEIILRDFYVDDLLTGASSEEAVIKLSKDIDNILKQAGFELRKWNSNNSRITQSISPQCNNTNQGIELGESSKVLGIFWLPSDDTLKYSVKQNNYAKVTKRTILSIISQIYDPLGLVCPVTVTARILIQKLWQSKLHWDESIPTHLYTKWTEFTKQLPTLNDLIIPRRVIAINQREIELHGFCDASTNAYGACVYIKTIDQENISHTYLLCAKTRVAPVKTISIPRLELSGAVLLAELVNKVKNSLNVKINRYYYWCDSTITLAWLRSSSQRWQTFVANRVITIQDLTDPSDWYHIRSHDNPADIASRGVNNLKDNQLWWFGPSWLKEDNSFWPVQGPACSTTLETKKIVDMSYVITSNEDIFNRFSSFIKLKRVIAYMLRFVRNCKLPKNNRNFDCLSLSELETAEILILKCVQIQCFPDEHMKLKSSSPINKGSKLICLHPFLDEHDLIRVGGRLKQSNFHSDKKHPIMLPNSHHISNIIIQNEHVRLFHCGPQTLLASIRERYWPISGRNLTRKIVRSCVTCFRANPSSNNEIMGNLPAHRLKPNRPFLVSGVDYAGPFFIKDRKTRGAKLIKSYVCLFICFSTKAIHLELVCDLTTQSFLSALRRFMSRRGMCSDIYSDNATNFVGANNDMTEIHNLLHNKDNNISNLLLNEKIRWHFIPPKSPHFGGLWEAGIKSTKFHLKRVLCNTKFTYEHFNTVLVQVEAILNSRPLSPLSHDPNDLNPLTPAHFLIGERLTALPDVSRINIPESRMTIYEHMQKLQQHFWTRWAKEYVSELQQRTKWKTTSQLQIKPGLMVIIKDDNAPPLQWNLGRVVTTHPGTDNIVRVVSLKTASGILKRPISKLCILPIDI